MLCCCWQLWLLLVGASLALEGGLGQLQAARQPVSQLLGADASPRCAARAQEAAQGDPCSPLPLPPGGEAFTSDNGVTNPALLDTLVKVCSCLCL